MPVPKLTESRDEFVSRCIPVIMDEGKAKDTNQAVAICINIFKSNVPDLYDTQPKKKTDKSQSKY